MAGQLKFSQIRWVSLKSPLSFAFFESWLKQGQHAGMKYLETQKPLRANIQSWAPLAKSVIVVTLPYLDHPYKDQKLMLPKNLKIAKYAKGIDYHTGLTQGLETLANELKQKFPNAYFKCVTDSTPLMERDLAYQAGLGWFGKNTCLIDRKQGSFFLIGEIITDLSAPDAHYEVSPDFCGHCNRCVEACPTQALSQGPTLDANKCISYWNIESQSLPPVDIRTKIGDWFFGCDICQDVCPWNQKPINALTQKLTTQSSQTPSPQTLAQELRFYLRASNREILNQIQHTPLARARPFGLRRNAMIVACNTGQRGLLEDIQACGKKHPRLQELSLWAEGCLS